MHKFNTRWLTTTKIGRVYLNAKKLKRKIELMHKFNTRWLITTKIGRVNLNVPRPSQ